MAHNQREPDMIGVQAVYSRGKLIYKKSRTIDKSKNDRKYKPDKENEDKD